MTIYRSVVFYDGSLYGYLFIWPEYFELGGALLLQAFRNYHVQLVFKPSGEIGIVDDMDADAFWFVDNVKINMLPCDDPEKGRPWEVSTEQSSHVHDQLADAASQSRDIPAELAIEF
jgi:hypothetical protein